MPAKPPKKPTPMKKPTPKQPPGFGNFKSMMGKRKKALDEAAGY